VKNIAVIGSGIIGICTAFFLQKSGFKVTIFDKQSPGSMTSFGHACTFADYANVPINSPSVYKDIPKMLLRSDGPLAVDFSYVIKNLPWAFKFLKNCRKEKVNEIASSLATILHHSRLSYDYIFKEVQVSQYIKNEENIYIYESRKAYEDAKYSTILREKNNIKVKELSKKDIHDLEPNLAQVYYAGQLFVGSRHTTNPLAISKKIFENFLLKDGKYINQNVRNIIQKEKTIEVFTEDQNIEFDQIVVCAGAWSNYIANMIGDDFPLDTERGYHVLFESDKNIINRPVGWSQSGFYLIQIEDGIRAAGTVEIAGLTKPPNTNRLKMIEREARKILPQLKNVKSTWMGNRPTLPDSLPIIGKSNKNENVLYAFGHQHIGWTLAAVTGKAINELIKGSQPNFNISYFSPERFNK